MPIVSPQLADLTYDRVVAELTRRIPVYSPEWTDFNDSDPGYTLIQLFAYLAEVVGYRLNRIPEKNQIELLKLLGIELKPAHAATTRLAFLLQDPPNTVAATTLLAGSSAKAKAGSPPPAFETVADMDLIPAQPVVLLATLGPDLRNLRLKANHHLNKSPSEPTTYWLTPTWDGKSPNLKDMPLAPVTLVPAHDQRHVWLGVNFNPAIGAGFLGVQVTLTVQFDDDEQPTLTVDKECGPQPAVAVAGKVNNWLWYFDAQEPLIDHSFKLVPGRLDDTTERLSHSGTIAFTVPTTLGAIPKEHFLDLSGADPAAPTQVEICQALADNISKGVKGLTVPSSTTDCDGVAKWIKDYSTALQAAVDTTKNPLPPNPDPVVPHPLDPSLRGTMGWFRIDLAAAPARPLPSAKLRMITFNAVSATQSTTVVNELLGVADGTPGQTYSLANQNVQLGSLVVNVQESSPSDPQPLVEWTVVDNLDAAGPHDSQVALDPEAGTVTFGDGIHGRIPPLVPGGGQIVAMKYAWGGGEAGNVGVATITTLNSSAKGVQAVVNFVSAAGGRDPETLAEAEIRARKELSTRTRAVTASDFQWIATQTPNVEVAFAQVVPLRRPLGNSSTIVPVATTPCGQAVPAIPAGLEGTDSAGVVSVIVVPRQAGPEPTPTPSFLQAVCDYLDPHRLVTTEVYVVPPQFARLCNMKVSVKGQPGYTRDQLQDLVSARLATYLHVLTGGDDGTGYPFGRQLHIADLLAQVYRVAGVERVDLVTTDFVRTKTDASPRQGSLVLCPATSSQYSFLQLAPEETVSFNPDTFLLSTVV